MLQKLMSDNFLSQEERCKVKHVRALVSLQAYVTSSIYYKTNWLLLSTSGQFSAPCLFFVDNIGVAKICPVVLWIHDLKESIFISRGVLRWGKNISSPKTRTKKRAGVAVCNRASSLETLVGYLYLYKCSAARRSYGPNRFL